MVTGKVCTYSCLQGNLELSWLPQNCQFVRKYNGFVLPFGFSGSVPFPCIFHETPYFPAEEMSTVVWVVDVTLDLCSPKGAVHWPLGSLATCPLDHRRESCLLNVTCGPSTTVTLGHFPINAHWARLLRKPEAQLVAICAKVKMYKCNPCLAQGFDF